METENVQDVIHKGKRTIYTAGRPPWYDTKGELKEAFVIGELVCISVLADMSKYQISIRCRPETNTSDFANTQAQPNMDVAQPLPRLSSLLSGVRNKNLSFVCWFKKTHASL